MRFLKKVWSFFFKKESERCNNCNCIEEKINFNGRLMTRDEITIEILEEIILEQNAE